MHCFQLSTSCTILPFAKQPPSELPPKSWLGSLWSDGNFKQDWKAWSLDFEQYFELQWATNSECVRALVGADTESGWCCPRSKINLATIFRPLKSQIVLRCCSRLRSYETVVIVFVTAKTGFFWQNVG